MALKPCRECGAQVSTGARECPQCGVGAPTRNASRLRAESFADTTERVIFWLVVGGLVFGIMFWISQPKTAEQQAQERAQKAQAMAIAERAIAAVRKPTWETVEIGNVTEEDYNFVLWYRNKPDRSLTIEADTRLLIRAVLTELKNAGVVVSSRNNMLIGVWADQHTVGETGQPLVRSFGRARYLSIRDQIEFFPP